ncbi:MAG: topoisomerase DNA-binding C4 zinc finger domain-containing protein [Coprobacillus cateniformis]|uniref:topoisomerase DNA-binding C4 zinc finger domain-containing protein n=1 Tax=Coprobacillus cateniformis TaxID=100884 RepID=UPI0039905BB1
MKCPKCGSKMIYKKGRFGQFEACSNYPECKYIKNEKKKAEPQVTDEVCPNCGSPVVIKRGRFGEFKACSAYPKCKTIIK